MMIARTGFDAVICGRQRSKQRRGSTSNRFGPCSPRKSACLSISARIRVWSIADRIVPSRSVVIRDPHGGIVIQTDRGRAATA